MPANVLVTGPPRIGKTTVLERTADALAAEGWVVDGLTCPDLRADGARVGFAICDRRTGDERILAHVDRAAGPAVGKYRVDLGALDEASARVLPRARRIADLVLVDEIAPMQLHSRIFVAEVRRTLDDGVPVLAAVHAESGGFADEVRNRPDVDLYAVDRENRDHLPGRISARLASTFGK